MRKQRQEVGVKVWEAGSVNLAVESSLVLGT